VRQNFSSASRWEPIVGYSRAVRIGPHVWVAGCTATGPEGEFIGGDMYAQASQALSNIAAALAKAGATPADVVRTRTFITDIGQWEAAGRAHGEMFSAVRPVATMVEVPRLIHPEMLIEIEAEAYCEG
jgi:enamine deaminase RidA (YjgF/YER057c/UK114 family)